MCYKLIIILVFLFHFVDSAHSTTVEGYGDSLTSGFFNYTHAWEPFWETQAQRQNLRMYALAHNFFPRRANARLATEEDRNRAWLAKLGAKMQTIYGDVRWINRGVTMARARDLFGQIVRPEPVQERVFAFFFMGHNDLCETGTNGFDTQAFVNQYHAGLAHWDANHQNATAFLIPIGDIPRVFQTVDRYIWNQSPRGEFLTCQEIRQRFFPFCQKAYAPGGSPAIVSMNRWYLNDSLAVLAAYWSQIGKPRGNRYVYLEGALDEPYYPQYFGADCFHLSEAGHDAVADSIFRRAFPYFESTHSGI
jgi:lysophospholipase L1-like esterase